jgi:hypothetical protein
MLTGDLPCTLPIMAAKAIIGRVPRAKSQENFDRPLWREPPIKGA